MHVRRKGIGVILGITLVTALSCGEEPANDDGPNGDGGPDSDTDSDGGGDTGGGIQVGGACDAAERAGGFRVSLTESYTSVTGSVYDGVNPSNIAVELDSEGACVLLSPSDLTCSPACSGDETCGFGETCIPAPLQYDAGTVTLDGMNAPVSMEPNAFNFSYSATIRDPNPAFDPGATIKLSATGGERSPFNLEATGVSPITSSETALPVDRDTPVEVIWNPDEAAGDDVYVHINFSVNTHGATTGWIVCDVPDTGSYAIPASLVTQLINLGLSGWPEIQISRQSDASTTIEPGCVDLLVFSEIRIPIELPGLVSCSEEDPCPDGQVCLDTLMCADQQ